MELTLNGQRKVHDGSAELNVLTYLREVAGIVSPKDGCSGEGVSSSTARLASAAA